MNGTAERHEADEILAELPARISDIIKPFARQSPDHPALVQGDVTWTLRRAGFSSSSLNRTSASTTIWSPSA
jgi:hypothetical protein